MRVSPLAAAAVLLAALACRAAPLPPPPLGEVMARAEAAEHAPEEWPEGRMLVLSGPAKANGLPASARLALAGDGRFRLDVEGPLAHTTAFDGRAPWTREGRGPARRMALGEGDAPLLLAWVIGGYWLDPHAPLQRSVVAARRDVVTLAVARPESVAPLLLEVGGDGLPRAVLASGGAHPARWRLEGWHALAGRVLPESVTFEGSDAAGSRLELARASWEPLDAATFARPEGAPDARFDPAITAEIPVRRLASGHLVVPVSLDGGEPRWFLLDTGAGATVVDDRIARHSGAPVVGVAGAVGGAGRTLARMMRLRSIAVGPLTVESPAVLSLDLDGFAVQLDESLGGHLDGVIGWDLFGRAAVSIELPAADAAQAKPRVSIQPPGGIELPDGDWRPALAPDGVAALQGGLPGGLSGWFLVDTGAAWTVALNTPTVDRLGLPGDRPTRQGQLRGVGGQGHTLVTQLDWIEIAGTRIERPEAHLALVLGGSLADAAVLGNVGLGALAGRRLVLDLARERGALLPLPSEGDPGPPSSAAPPAASEAR